MRELDLQKHIVDAAIASGGFGFKCSHRMILGVADLWIQLPGLLGVWIEVKFHKGRPVRGVARLEMTPHQRRFIRGVLTAGGRGGWLLGVETAPGRIEMYCGTEPVERVELVDPIVRERGESWPILGIVERLQ